ncbi:MAG: aspartate kinase, partial [Bacteroidetes bacterium]|nr:aspartate kinase [Bacteroidota bacterium]
MKVFKFGGASVKDAAGVRNVAKVLSHFAQDDLLIVVSAMGKTTNALEEVVKAYREGRNAKPMILALQGMHAMALGEVAPSDQAAGLALAASFDELKQYVTQPVQHAEDRDYDHIVAFGEMWSTLIVSAYLNAAGFANQWVDARKIITTDGRHRAANVKWDRLEENCATHLPSFAAQPHRI